MRSQRSLGEVFGLTEPSCNVGSQIGAGFKSLAGGEVKGMTKNLIASRQEVTERIVQKAETKGADAVLAMRFDTSEMGVRESDCPVVVANTNECPPQIVPSPSSDGRRSRGQERPDAAHSRGPRVAGHLEDASGCQRSSLASRVSSKGVRVQ